MFILYLFCRGHGRLPQSQPPRCVPEFMVQITNQKFMFHVYGTLLLSRTHFQFSLFLHLFSNHWK
jgi:hypothetical protein